MLIRSHLILWIVLILANPTICDEVAYSFGLDGQKHFSFEIPDGWAISSPISSNSTAGNLSLTDSCARISLEWCRDPGMDLQNIANQIKGSYDGGGVRILSSAMCEGPSEGRTLETVNLVYDLNGYRAEKRFAIWNSSKSDRLFLASLTECSRTNDNNYNNSINSFFNVLISSFSDLGKGESVSFSRATPPDNAWGIVLGDLLSSYHYQDERTLPGRTIRISVLHSLTPRNGNYDLDSQETIFVEPQKIAISRAGAVLEILRQAGYQATLVQKGGEIAVGVKDPSGAWQKVSLNPTEPERMIGVLYNGTANALRYSNLAQMAAANGITETVNTHNIVQKDSEPSRFVELKAPQKPDQSWLDNLTILLDSYDYEKYYEENVFDGSNTSQISCSLLQQNGYDARLIMSYAGHPLDPHMWVVVKYPYEADRYVAIETVNTHLSKELVHLGKIVGDSDYFKGIMYNSSIQFSRMHPEEGMWLEALKINRSGNRG